MTFPELCDDDGLKIMLPDSPETRHPKSKQKQQISLNSQQVHDLTVKLCEKSVGTTELHYSSKKREHCFSILTAFFVRHSSEYETSDSDRKVK